MGLKKRAEKKDILLDKERKKKERERKKEEEEKELERKVARVVVRNQKFCDVFLGGCIRVVKSFLSSNHCRSR